MINRGYHYLVAGLPGIAIGERLWTSMSEFRAQLGAHLHPDDFTQVRLVLLQEDHQNLLQFLKTGEIMVDTAANFSLEDFRNPENRIPGTPAETEFMPGYITEILAAIAREQSEAGTRQMAIGSSNQGAGIGTGTGNKPGIKNRPGTDNGAVGGKSTGKAGDGDRISPEASSIIPGIQKKLDEGFFRLIMEQGNEFLRGYYTFQYDLDNLLAFIKSGIHGKDQQEFITGETPHAQHLRQYAGRNLVKDPEMELFEEITSITGNTSFAEEEKLIDQLRWRVIEEMNRFNYFTVDQVLGYLLQMQIAHRWEQLDRESGEQQLRKLIDVSYRKLAEQQLTRSAGAE